MFAIVISIVTACSLLVLYLFWFCRFKPPFRTTDNPPQLHVELANVHKRVARNVRGRAAIRGLVTIVVGIGVVYVVERNPRLRLWPELWPSMPSEEPSWFVVIFTALSIYFLTFSVWALLSRRRACSDWMRAMAHLERPLSQNSLPKSVSQTVNRLSACSQQTFFTTVKPFGKLAKQDYSLSSFWIWVFESIAPATEKNELRKKRISEEITEIDKRILEGTSLFSMERLNEHYGRTGRDLIFSLFGTIAGVPAAIFLVWKILNTLPLT